METLPARFYRDPDIAAREREAVFGSSWQLVTHLDRLREPGQALATTLAGWPLLLVRGDDGVLRAFHNACRHRAGPLLWDGEATRCQTLRCRYHGWQYGLDGRLLRTPDFGGDAGADGLFPVTVDTWRSLVFVHIGEPAAPLASALAPFAEAAVAAPFEAFQFDRIVTHDLDCDWKTYVENYLEGYHIPYMHPRLAREVEVKQYAVTVGEGFVTHDVPAKGDEGVYQGFWAWLWPNVAFNVYKQGMNLERILPMGPGRTRIEYTFLFRADADADERERTCAMSALVTGEDKKIVEAVQRNLDAGVYQTGRLSPKHEAGVAAFQGRIRHAVEGGSGGAR